VNEVDAASAVLEELRSRAELTAALLRRPAGDPPTGQVERSR
jgi:hypothetical protein